MPRIRVGVLALLLGLPVACKNSATGLGDPTALAIVNRSNLAYRFGVAIFTQPAQSDTLTHSTGNDSVCTQIPAAGNAYEVLFGVPDDTTNPHLLTQVFTGGVARGLVLYFGPKAVGNDTIVLTLSPSTPC